MTETKTWADNFGRWHAVVADTPRSVTVATEAIAHELATREPRDFNKSSALVAREIVSIPDAGPGFVHFAEYAID